MPTSLNIDGKYQWVITDKNGNFLADLSGKATDRHLNFVRNGSYSADFKCDLDTMEQFCNQNSININSVFNVGVSQLKVSRLNLPFYGGQLAYLDTEIAENKSMDIKVNGWLDLFKDRYSSISQIFTSTDAGAIAWGLINYSQMLANGSFGITMGNIQTSVPRTRPYEWKNIRDAIIELAEVYQGFDFEFSWDKKFNVFYPSMGVTHNEFSFRYPGNVKDLKISTDATKMINYNIVRGQGLGDGQLVDIRQDITAQTNFQLRQAVTDYSDIIDITTLDSYGDEDVRISKNPIDIIEIHLDANRPPYFGSYWLGDKVLLQVYDIKKYAYINGYYTINEIDLTIDEEDNEDVTLKVSNV